MEGKYGSQLATYLLNVINVLERDNHVLRKEGVAIIKEMSDLLVNENPSLPHYDVILYNK